MRRAGANATFGFVVASLWFHGAAGVVVAVMPRLSNSTLAIEAPRAANTARIEMELAPTTPPTSVPNADDGGVAAPSPETAEQQRARERERQREIERERERERLRFVTPTMVQAPPPPPPQQALGRQSVQQAQSNDQVASDARFLAERNNNVAEETVAAVRGTQEDQSNPQHAATQQRAPGQGAGAEDVHDGRRNREGELLAQVEQHVGGRRTPTTSASATGATNATSAAASQGGTAAGAQGASGAAQAPTSPEPSGNRVFASSEGVWGQYALTPQQRTGLAARPTQGAAGQGGQGGQNGSGGSGGGIRAQVAGRGADGVVAAFSPASTDYARAFGSQVEQERRLARERRTEARGETPTESWQQLRQGIENYTQAVRVGNQTALRTAASPFATYLSNMHHRIHRLFADGFLAGLEAGSTDNPLNDMNLHSTVEIVLERDGRVSRIGIVRSSGSTMFDVASMNSVRRSAPFGDAPEQIRSADGKVYIHWGFYRNERQCGTFNAEPFVLSGPTASGTRERTTIIAPRAGRDR